MSNSTSETLSAHTANRSVTRAIAVLRALSGSPEPLTVTDVSKKIGLPRATAFRLLLTLEEEGFVDRQDTLYSLGWDLARIARSVDPAAGLVSRVRQVVEEIAEELSETVTLSLRQGVYELDLILQVAPRTIGMTMSDMQGMRWPLHASATGKLLLAELSPEEVRLATGGELEQLTEKTIIDPEMLAEELARVRNQGWASTVDELEDGIFSVTVPIRDEASDLIAALTFVAPTHRIQADGTAKEKTAGLMAGADRVRRRMIVNAGEWNA